MYERTEEGAMLMVRDYRLGIIDRTIELPKTLTAEEIQALGSLRESLMTMSDEFNRIGTSDELAIAQRFLGPWSFYPMGEELKNLLNNVKSILDVQDGGQ